METRNDLKELAEEKSLNCLLYRTVWMRSGRHLLFDLFYFYWISGFYGL